MIATYADYVAVTGDAVAAQVDVETALVWAQARAEELTERLFDSAERTETLPKDADGNLWPLAYPISAVSAPDGALPSPDGLCVTTGSTPVNELFEDVWGFPVDALPGVALTTYVTVTYTGGWAPADAPRGLVDAICELANRRLEPADTIGVPAGVTSVTMGGAASQSYSGRALGGSSAIPPSLRQQIRAYRHVQARSAD